MTDTLAIDSYEPDYDSICIVCGESPTVTGVTKEKTVYDSEMCGPCTFGTASALDPEWWNR